MKEIKLTRNHIALVDDEDYERINKYKWHVAISKSNAYAARSVGNHKIWMHRMILRLRSNDWPTTEIDHIDRNSLNNQKYNLRVVTHQQNLRNSRNSQGNIRKIGNLWEARITMFGLRVSQTKKTKEEALKLIEEWDEYACTK